MNQKKENIVLLLSLLITASSIGMGAWWLFANSNRDGSGSEIVSGSPSVVRLSTGDRLLFPQDNNPNKQAAAEAIASENYSEAVTLLEQSLSQQRNDPEALIYLNNARIGKDRAYGVAVSLPISTEASSSKEILRGVAQAQTEINARGGINNVPLQIVTLDDDNNPQTAVEIARNLSKNNDILGVIGHFSSDVTLAAAPIYEQNKLVAISPSSTSIAISNQGNYIFRTVPSDRFTSSALAKYFLEQLQLTKAAIVYNSQSAYSRSLQSTFTTDLVGNGGEIVGEVDLSRASFNPAAILKQMQASGAEAIVFLNDSKTIDKVYSLIQLNDRQLPLLGGDSLYKPQILENGGSKAIGLVVGVPWHALASGNPEFPEAARRLWGGEVNWRTAMAYDATIALAEGMRTDPSRKGIQQALSGSDFNLSGASGKIKFLSSGDRNMAVQLVEVRPGNNSSYGYDFVPLE